MIERLREVRVLYLREMRSALRERNIVINSLLLPIVFYPAILWLVYSGISFVAGQSEIQTSRVVLEGVPLGHRALIQSLEEHDGVEIVAAEGNRDAVRAGEIDAWVRFRPAPESEGGGSALAIEVVYDASKPRSRTTLTRLQQSISGYRQQHVLEIADGAGVARAEVQQVWIEQRNLASGVEMGRFILGLMAPMFLIIMLSVGAMYPAVDATAGERENSTWETLMTVSARRGSILFSKYLYVATMSFAAGLLNLAAMTFTMKAVLRPLAGDRVEGLDVALPFGAIPVIVLGAALMALFIAAGMMILASFARTFKEGQSMIGPFYIAMILPILFIQSPDIEFTPRLALIPIVNVTLMFREAIAGVYQWPLIGMTLAVELLSIGLALALAYRILQHEDFLLGGYSGHFGRFLRQRIVPGSGPVGGRE